MAISKAPTLYSTLQFVNINILGPLTNIRKGNRLIVVDTNRYKIRTWSILIAKDTTPVGVTVFPERCIKLYVISNTILSDNSPDFVS